MRWTNEGLDKILCEGPFQLQTLYCNDVLDVCRIVKSQTELQMLGIYTNGSPDNLLKTLKQFHSAQVSLPIVFTLERESFSPVFDHISIFPAFYPVDRSATIHQVLVKSFDEDQGSDMRADANEVTQLSIYLVDSSDIPTIRMLAKGMATSFPQIAWLNFFFERRCDIPSQEMKEVLSLFSDLYKLNFNLWPRDYENAEPKILEDVKMAHAKEWEVACPELVSVSFINGATLQKGSKEGDWGFYR